MRIGGDGVDVFGMYALALIINVAGLLWACGVAMRFRSLQAGPIMQMPVFLTLFFAPVYVPLALLSGWIATVAHLNPITFVLESVRGLLAGEPVHTALAFGLALALVAGFSLWALRGLRSAEAAG
jgi:ABC-2 type transport system permease protein